MSVGSEDTSFIRAGAIPGHGKEGGGGVTDVVGSGARGERVDARAGAVGYLVSVPGGAGAALAMAR